jgi:hypothetical protein
MPAGSSLLRARCYQDIPPYAFVPPDRQSETSAAGCSRAGYQPVGGLCFEASHNDPEKQPERKHKHPSISAAL